MNKYGVEEKVKDKGIIIEKSLQDKMSDHYLDHYHNKEARAALHHFQLQSNIVNKFYWRRQRLIFYLKGNQLREHDQIKSRSSCLKNVYSNPYQMKLISLPVSLLFHICFVIFHLLMLTQPLL